MYLMDGEAFIKTGFSIKTGFNTQVYFKRVLLKCCPHCIFCLAPVGDACKTQIHTLVSAYRS